MLNLSITKPGISNWTRLFKVFENGRRFNLTKTGDVNFGMFFFVENTDNAESTSAQIGPPLRNQQLRQLLQFTEDSCSDRDTDADDSSGTVLRNRIERPAR